MTRSRILSSVSIAALMTTVGVTTARADNAQFDLTAVPPVLDMAAKSASVIATTQIDTATKITATVTNPLFGSPTKGTHDFGGGTDTITVATQSGYANVISNTSTSAVDLYAATGTGATSAATIGTLQSTTDIGTATLASKLTGGDVRIAALDLGKGSSATLDSNTLTTSTVANVSFAEISGDINPSLTSTELGLSTVTAVGAPYEVVTDATALVATS
ncbi:MAG: hypothetical protein GC201_15945, partial [Alphaproteobacteria bacterium]|nr:hypothetical protein [Alphaproteobacteria bacterium]